MTLGQTNWATLNAIAASFLASTPLAARIKHVTPPGGYSAVLLEGKLSDILAAAGPLSGSLIIAADTLILPAGETALTAPSALIIARSLQVDGGGTATLQFAGSTPIQILTSEIVGTVNVATGGGSVALAFSNLRRPQLLTVSGAPPSLQTSTQRTDIADVLHSPWTILALELISAVAGVLVDQDDPDSTILATNMLRFVTTGCQALIAERGQFQDVDWDDVASLQTASLALLTFTQAALSGAIYVPVLSSDVYEQEINALLAVAQTYDGKIAALKAGKDVDQTLKTFAQTLSDINQAAETPLFNTLARLADQSASVQNQLDNAALRLQRIGETLPELQEALTEAIAEEFQKELVRTAIDTLFTLVTLYVGAAAAVLGDPEAFAQFSAKAAAEALKFVQELIKEAQKGIDSAIADGAAAAGQPPSKETSEAARQGAEYVAGSLVGFGKASAALWGVVEAAIANGQDNINMSPDLLKAVEALPDLDGLSVGGLDPVAYWDAVVTQTKAAVEPHKALPEAAAYLTAVELTATYGRAVGDLQMKLLELFTQGLSAFDQLRSVYLAEQKWNDLLASLTDKQSQIDAAIGLLERGYLDVKRNLVIAVENYRAAFRYQWLQEPSIQVDVSMDFLTLEQQAANSILSLEAVLAGGSGGAPVQPRQDFKDVVYQVSASADELFDGNGEAQWSILSDDGQLSDQLSGDTALYLTDTLFELIGADQDSEVQLVVSTSGHYDNRLAGTAYRFVSKPFSMINDYRPGPPLDPITTWSFSDAAAYIKPTPYTNWSLKIVSGNFSGATVRMTLAGVLLQNPSAQSRRELLEASAD